MLVCIVPKPIFFCSTDHVQDRRAVLICILQLARHRIMSVHSTCFVFCVQASSRSSAWLPLPGILLEPRAHVQYGDFDKMVLMQACPAHTAHPSDLSVYLPVCLSVSVCFWQAGWLSSCRLSVCLPLNLFCCSPLWLCACASAQLINCMPASYLAFEIIPFIQHAQLHP